MKCRESYIKWSVLNFNTDHLDRNVNKVSVNQSQSMSTDKGVSLKVDFLGTLFSVYTFDIKKRDLPHGFFQDIQRVISHPYKAKNEQY